MKKLIFIIFIVVIVLTVVIWGLSTRHSQTKSIEEIPSNVNGVTISLNNSQINLDTPILEINFHNSSGNEVTFGSEWTIKRYDKGEWKTVFPIGDASFTSELFVVDPHSSRVETINLESYLEEKLIVGEYKIIKEIEIQQITYQIGASFKIKKR